MATEQLQRQEIKEGKQSSNSQPTTQLIFKAKVVNPGDHKVKVEFEMAKERLHMYQDGKHKSSSDFGEATPPTGSDTGFTRKECGRSYVESGRKLWQVNAPTYVPAK